MPDRLFEWRAKDALFYLDIRTAVSFCSAHRAKCSINTGFSDGAHRLEHRRRSERRYHPLRIERKLLLGGTYDATAATITRITPGWVIALAFVIIGIAYSVVNHTQAMRMFALGCVLTFFVLW